MLIVLDTVDRHLPHEGIALDPDLQIDVIEIATPEVIVLKVILALLVRQKAM